MRKKRKSSMQSNTTTSVVRCNLAKLMEDKSARDGRTLTKHRLHVETGIAPGTISDYYDSNREQYDVRVVGILCRYFECTVGDLLELDGGQSAVENMTAED